MQSGAHLGGRMKKVFGSFLCANTIKKVFLSYDFLLFKLILNNKFVGQIQHRVMITVTDSAKKKAIQLMDEEGKPNSFIRVGVQGGGCSGLMYQLNFDNQISEDDREFEDNGVKVVVDKKSYLYLIGTVLDYSGGLNGKGFVFQNPNADRTCGCGESFSV